MCSCVGKAEAKPQASGYSITRVHYDMVYGMNIYRVSTPKGTFEVLWEKDRLASFNRQSLSQPFFYQRLPLCRCRTRTFLFSPALCCYF